MAMQDFQMLGHDLSRRAFVHQAMIGVGALSLPNLFRLRVAADDAPSHSNRSLILLWQDGGPSHFETFDPKPSAPSEYRGELGAIDTSLPGVQFCEVLPRLAQMAHRFSVIRSIHQPSSGHVDGSHNFLTGWDGGTVDNKSKYPDLAAVIHRMRSDAEDAGISIGASTDPRLARGMRSSAAQRRDAERRRKLLPQYVGLGGQSAIGVHRGGPAYLGPTHGPFEVAGDPSKPRFQIQNLRLTDTADRLSGRLDMLHQLDRYDSLDNLRHNLDLTGQMDGWDRFQRQAFDLLTGSGAAARAFDLTREDRRLRERYGLHTAGQQALLARRLVEAGVSVVAVRFSPDGRGDGDRSGIGWDDHAVHGNIFEIMRKRGPQFDQAVSALFEDLSDRGLDEQVMVVIAGEFGRTPLVADHKGCPGREHWGPAANVAVFGGGLNMGQVIGSTTSKGERPADRPLKTQDVLATIYHSLGIDPRHEFMDLAGRPVPILSAGQPISELVG
jgi:hypothetical protein